LQRLAPVSQIVSDLLLESGTCLAVDRILLDLAMSFCSA